MAQLVGENTSNNGNKYNLFIMYKKHAALKYQNLWSIYNSAKIPNYFRFLNIFYVKKNILTNGRLIDRLLD